MQLTSRVRVLNLYVDGHKIEMYWITAASWFQL